MKRMICRNRVKDFEHWKAIFDENLEGAKDSGFELENLWREVDAPNNVFFVFRIENVELAQAFISDPAAAETGERSGVLDGDCWIVE